MRLLNSVQMYLPVCGKRDNYVTVEAERMRARVYEINGENVCARM